MRKGLLVIGTTCLLGGCTVFSSSHRHTVDLLDENLTPGSRGARIALLPVAVPVGLMGLTVDAVVVNPVLAVDDAWQDTRALLWSAPDETSFRRAMFVPFAALATPVVFTGDWLWRSLWPLEPVKPVDATEPAGAKR